MSGANVQMAGLPLTRLNPWYPGQMGVPGTDNETGLRHSPTGTVFYVDPNYPGASDQRDGTNPTDPLLTIAAAITKCQPFRGDVIVVAHNSNWQYAAGGLGIAGAQYATGISEEVTLDVDNVRLIGMSYSGIGVPWNPASNGGTCLTVTAQDCIVEGFIFTEGQVYAGCNGINAIWNSPASLADNLTVRNCMFDDTVTTAILLNFTYDCDIHNNVFRDSGIGISAINSADFAKIHHNLFRDCATNAISAAASAESSIYLNNFYNAAAAAGAAPADCFIIAGARAHVARNTMSCALGAEYTAANTPGAASAWIHNYLLNGVSTGNP